MPLVHKLCPNITCHAWSPDRKRVAVCQNTEDVLIYANCDRPVDQWTVEHTLKGHDLVVSAIDWSPANGKIVTCSHDRNAFVWTLERGKWKPSLSILRINRAALSVQWSPDGTKFAVASGAKVVPVCHYEAQNDWWISKMIKKHKSTVIDVAWHPNSQLLATASSDFRCRVFSAYIPEVKTGSPQTILGDLSKGHFGDVLAEFDASHGWVEGVAWSPSGTRLAFVGHDATVSFVHFGGPGSRPSCQTIKSKTLPNTCAMFMSENVLVAAGHDYNPSMYQCNSDGFWTYLGYADKESVATEKRVKSMSGFSKARLKFAEMVTGGKDNVSNDLKTNHMNCITNIKPYSEHLYKSKIDSFSTSALDGRIIVWSVKNIGKHMSQLKL